MTTWYERVVKKLQQFEETEEADKDAFRALFKQLDDYRSKNDGETLIRDGDGATKRYKGDDVFWFSVKGGKIIVRAANGEEESFTDGERALDKMAELMACAARRPTVVINTTLDLGPAPAST